MNKRTLLLFFLTFPCALQCSEKKSHTSPEIVIVFVVDQFAYHYLEKIKPFCTGGLKRLLDNGIVYTDAHYPHAMPSTGPGHTALSTGTNPKDNGIIGDLWFNDVGKKICCDDDNTGSASVLSPHGVYPHGKSAINIMVDSLSDQMIIHDLHHTHAVFSISHKSRSAIAMAGKQGKAVWFDHHASRFTSSKAYFEELPAWLAAHNKKLKKSLPKGVVWKPTYSLKSAAYAFDNSTNYEFARFKNGFIKSSIPTNTTHFLKTPRGQRIVLDCARECLETHLKNKQSTKLLLWVSLSSLDKLGHALGPESREALDLLYHFDQDLAHFMSYLEKKVPQQKILYMLTGDHGVMPIPELLARKGVNACRIYAPHLIKALNNQITKKLHLPPLIAHFKMPQLYFDPVVWKPLTAPQKSKVIALCKKLLLSHSHIKAVWTFDELAALPVEKDSIESYYKNQLYPGRSGELTIQVIPYTQIASYKTGTAHETPYDYDTHVPLMLYQSGTLEKATVTKRVWMQQCAPRLADLLEVERPSASIYKPLPLS